MSGFHGCHPNSGPNRVLSRKRRHPNGPREKGQKQEVLVGPTGGKLAGLFDQHSKFREPQTVAAVQRQVCAEKQGEASSQMQFDLEPSLFLIGILLTIVQAVVMVTRSWAFVVIMKSFWLPGCTAGRESFFMLKPLLLT